MDLGKPPGHFDIVIITKPHALDEISVFIIWYDDGKSEFLNF